MGIEDFIEEAAGAFAAEKGLEAVDPTAGALAKVAAVVAGFEGVGAIKNKLGEASQAEAVPAEQAAQTNDDDSQTNG
jgi:hypothetical protein